MKNKTILIVLYFLILGCHNKGEFEKPFVIVGKSIDDKSIETFYAYTDKGKWVHTFYDKDKYNIGDTLK